MVKCGPLSGVLALALGCSATAQDRISAEEFLARVNGKTVSFYSQTTGRLVGVEQFLSPRLSVWRGQQNRCVYGEITTPDGLLCFLYRDLGEVEPVWWTVFDREGTLMALGVALCQRSMATRRRAR